MSVVSASIKHPFATIVAYIVLCLFGAISVTRMEIALLPVIELPTVSVVSAYPGMPAHEIEPLLTEPVENAVASVDGVRRIRSAVQPGISRTTLEFAFGTNMQIALNAVRQAADSVYPTLPDGSEYPLVQLAYTNRDPAARLVIAPVEPATLEDIAHLTTTDIASTFRGDAAVGSVHLFGVPRREVHIAIDGDAIAGAGIPVQEIASTVAAHIIDRPVGTVRNGTTRDRVIATTDVATFSSLAAIPLRGAGMSVGDVATVRMGVRPPTAAYLHNGAPAIGVSLYPASSAGPFRAALAAEGIAARLTSRFGDVLTVEVIESQARPIGGALRALMTAIGIGIVAATVVLFLVYRSASAVVTILASIVPSLSTVMFGMYLADVSINVISLSGIAIGVGMIFDNAIVVFDAYAAAPRSTAAERSQAVHGVLGATAGSTISTVLVFVPVLFIPGVVGAVFSQLAFALIVLVVVSFVGSATLTPAVAALFGDARLAKAIPSGGSRHLTWYRRIVRVTLRHRWIAPLAVGIVAAVFGALLDVLPRQLVPSLPGHVVEVDIVLSPETDIEGATEIARRITTQVIANGAARITADIGYLQDDLESQADPENRFNRISMRVLFPDLVRPTDIPRMRASFGTAAAAEGAIATEVALPRDPIVRILGEADPGRFEIRASTRGEIESLYQRVVDALRRQFPTAEISTSSEPSTPVHLLEIDRRAIATTGTTAREVVQTVATLIEGALVGTIEVGSVETDVRVWLDGREERPIASLPDIRLSFGDRQILPLSSVATVRPGTTPTLLHRTDRRPAYIVSVAGEGPPAEYARVVRSVAPGAVQSAQSALEEAAFDILTVFIIAIALMFLAFVAQFESLTTAFFILLALPLSATGSLGLMRLLDKTININSVLGLLVMFGTTVNSAILLATAVRSRATARVPLLAARRLRPLFATVGTTLAALLPIVAFGVRVDTFESHTAVALLGGLLLGAVAIPFLLPSLLSRPNRRRA